MGAPGRTGGARRLMITDQEFAHFLVAYCGMTEPSVTEYRIQFPRWRRRLASLGIDQLPPFPAFSPSDVAATNQMLLLIKQGADSRDASGGHNLRDLTRVRPYKG